MNDTPKKTGPSPDLREWLNAQLAKAGTVIALLEEKENSTL